MSYFVVVPGALVPAAVAPALAKRSGQPILARRLRRGRAGAATNCAPGCIGAAHLGWLWSLFGGVQDPPVTAPYVWRALNRGGAIEAASELPLWHLDPVHFAFARDRLLVRTLQDDPPTAEESRGLLALAAEAAVEAGATVRTIDSRHWFITFDPPWSLATVPLQAAVGRSAQEVLPEGDDAPRWRKLLTEIQIRWAHDPVNQRREAEGRLTINGVWLHGGGSWEVLPKRPFAAVASADPLLSGWALASGVAPAALASGPTAMARGDAVLDVWPALHAARAFEDWDAWCIGVDRLAGAVEQWCEQTFAARGAHVTLVAAGRHSVRPIELRRHDALRIWRSARLADLLAEEDLA
jgi:hypothetical protein